ncbi:hypothetical protein [Candidatus Neoehrlichia procyonis]|uniref:Uncharacterized protein n=1 Tax=Candidatus Neoehrlichia procyonis str. RAC413 TaxID=1359163 RepID=A0A0F3NMJ5_9RICK|nr:hypothetical protein [Candidatus Neoehrlichia lotoris]KJV69283.1 hypothetical protein NLO413_0669 [Candidatus Neoehrlichia lotoris str. RAC413]
MNLSTIYSGESSITKELTQNTLIKNILLKLQHKSHIQNKLYNFKLSHHHNVNTYHAEEFLSIVYTCNTNQTIPHTESCTIIKKVNDLFNLYIIPIFILPSVHKSIYTLNSLNNIDTSGMLPHIIVTLSHTYNLELKTEPIPIDQIIACTSQKSSSIISKSHIILQHTNAFHQLFNILQNKEVIFTLTVEIHPLLIQNALQYIKHFNTDYIVRNLQLYQILQAYNTINPNSNIHTNTYNTAFIFNSYIIPSQNTINVCIMTDKENTHIPNIVTQTQYVSNSLTFHEVDTKHLQHFGDILPFTLNNSTNSNDKHEFCISLAQYNNVESNLFSQLDTYLNLLLNSFSNYYDMQFQILSSNNKFTFSNKKTIAAFIINSCTQGSQKLQEIHNTQVLYIIQNFKFTIKITDKAITSNIKPQSTAVQQVKYTTQNQSHEELISIALTLKDDNSTDTEDILGQHADECTLLKQHQKPNNLPKDTATALDGNTYTSHLTDPQTGASQNTLSALNQKKGYPLLDSNIRTYHPTDTQPSTLQSNLPVLNQKNKQPLLGGNTHTYHPIDTQPSTLQSTSLAQNQNSQLTMKSTSSNTAKKASSSKNKLLSKLPQLSQANTIASAFIFTVALADILYYSYVRISYIHITQRTLVDIAVALGSVLLISLSIITIQIMQYIENHSHQKCSSPNALSDVSPFTMYFAPETQIFNNP